MGKAEKALELLAWEAVTRTAQYLRAGSPGGDSAEWLCRVISDHLQQTDSKLFGEFCEAPGGDDQRARVVASVRDGLERSEKFGDDLVQAAGRAGIVPSGGQSGPVNIREFRNISGGAASDASVIANGGSKARRDTYNNFNLGGPALVGALVIAVFLGGGAGAVGTYNIVRPPAASAATVSMAQLVGTWEGKPAPGASTVVDEAMSMTVDASGNFKLSAIATIVNQAIPLACNGFATADGDHFGLHVSSGTCTLSSATLVRGGQALDIADGQGRGAITLIKK